MLLKYARGRKYLFTCLFVNYFRACVYVHTHVFTIMDYAVYAEDIGRVSLALEDAVNDWPVC